MTAMGKSIPFIPPGKQGDYVLDVYVRVSVCDFGNYDMPY